MNPPIELLDNRADPDCRAVLEDWEQVHGVKATRLGLVLPITANADAADAADVAAVAAVAADADAAAVAAAAVADAAAAADDADADADAAAADADDADADDAAAADAVADAAAAATDADADAAAAAADAADAAAANYAAAADTDAFVAAALSKLWLGDVDMRNGLKIVQLPGRYGYSVTRVGWLRRVSGDEWELVGARSIVRTSGARNLDSLASGGPGKDHRLTEPGEGVEEIHRLIIRRSLPANEKSWIEHCPKPKDWIANEH